MKKLGIFFLFLCAPVSTGFAEENARVLALGRAGVALSGGAESIMTNPAGLSEIDRWTLVTGFAGGADFQSRPGLSRKDHPDSMWANISEVALVIPIKRGMGLSIFANRIHNRNIFRAHYPSNGSSINISGMDLPLAGKIHEVKSSFWIAGLGWGMKIGSKLSVGLGGGVILLDTDSFNAEDYFHGSLPAPGFQTTFTRTRKRSQSGKGMVVIVSGIQKINDKLSLGLAAVHTGDMKIYTYQQDSLLLRTEVLPNFPFDERSIILPEEGSEKRRRGFEVDLGTEFRPSSSVRFVAEGVVRLPGGGDVLRWNLEDTAMGLVLDEIRWSFEDEMTFQIGLGAEMDLGKWSVRLGIRDEPSSSPRITDELKEQNERVSLRWGSFGVGYKNPFFGMDLGYAFGTGVGTMKEAYYQQGVIQAVEVIPIHRQELHKAVMTFSYLF